jgi:hypothetical protein
VNVSLLSDRARGAVRQVDLSGTVTTQPSFFYGSNTHAMHEKFGIRTDDGRSIEVIDNVKLAPKVPVQPGDRVRVVGEFIDDPKGPIVHWTHHDPRGTHPDGFIELDGVRYGRVA